MKTINNYNLYTSCHPEFKAKMPLNDCRQFLNAPIEGTGSLDVIFKENNLVKTLNNLYAFITKNIINRTFKNQDSKVGNLLKQSIYKIAKQIRILGIKIFSKQNKQEINNLSTFIPPESKEYIEELAKIGNSIEGKFVRINSEDRPLDCIATSPHSTIFVLNHPDYNKDKVCYTIINSLLSKIYVSQDRQSDCPRSKIIASKNLLNIFGEKLGAICENFLGTVYIDAGIKTRDYKANVSPMLKLLKDFIENKVNIFIFPEGNNSLVKDKPLEERIQSGVAGIIKSALYNKDSVRIIPVGLSYTGEKNSLGNIFIGKPIFFKKAEKEIIYTEGADKKKIKRTSRTELPLTILNEICKNLKYCMQKANELE